MHCEMIIAIDSFNLHHLIDKIKRKKEEKKKRKKCPLVILRFTLFKPSVYHTAVLAVVIMLYITSLLLVYLLNGSFSF